MTEDEIEVVESSVTETVEMPPMPETVISRVELANGIALEARMGPWCTQPITYAVYFALVDGEQKATLTPETASTLLMMLRQPMAEAAAALMTAKPKATKPAKKTKRRGKN